MHRSLNSSLIISYFFNRSCKLIIEYNFNCKKIYIILIRMSYFSAVVIIIWSDQLRYYNGTSSSVTWAGRDLRNCAFTAAAHGATACAAAVPVAP